jgi:dTDP-4-amino-4,6-dideoxygalactose transaminase
MTGVVPFLDLSAQARALGPQLHAAVRDVIDSGHYVLGESVEAFEQAFAAYCGVRFAVALNSGTSALHLALLASGIGPGDEVVTVPMTFVATVAAIQYSGAAPRFVDIDADRGTMDPAGLEAALSPRTAAIIPVHLHGRVANMAPILEIAGAHRLAVIEDAAQAHGACYHGQRAGSLGDSGCFSFYPGKNLGACGEGGAFVTNDPDLAKRVRILRDWGQEEKYVHRMRGFNYRMDAIQGTVLSVKLKHLDAWTQRRRAVAAQYDRQLAPVPLRLPSSADPEEHVYHVYAVHAARRDAVRQQLVNAGIATGIHYPIPVHLQPAYADLGYVRGDFPVAEAFAAETMSLPIFPEISTAQVDRVCSVLGDVLWRPDARVA